MQPPPDGLFHRLEQLATIISALPDELGDEEVVGLCRVLPPDTSRAMAAALAPHVRRGSLPFLKLTAAWIQRARQARERGRKVMLIPFNFPPDLYDLHKFSPCPVPNIYNLFSYGIRFTSWGLANAVEAMRTLVQVSRDRRQQGLYPAPQEVARCLWLYVGYYFDLWGLFNWMEQQGITYLHDALSLCMPLHYDTTSKETMLDSLAEAVFDYPMTRQMGAHTMSLAWMEDMVQHIQDLNANCAVFSGHHACKQTWSVFSKVKADIIQRTGVPVLCLQGDAWSRQMTSTSAVQEEIVAFVDSVVARKARRSERRRNKKVI